MSSLRWLVVDQANSSLVKRWLIDNHILSLEQHLHNHDQRRLRQNHQHQLFFLLGMVKDKRGKQVKYECGKPGWDNGPGRAAGI